jgi:hypothetical protein
MPSTVSTYRKLAPAIRNTTEFLVENEDAPHTVSPEVLAAGRVRRLSVESFD